MRRKPFAFYIIIFKVSARCFPNASAARHCQGGMYKFKDGEWEKLLLLEEEGGGVLEAVDDEMWKETKL